MLETRLTKAVNLMVRTNHMHKSLIDSRVGSLGIHRTHHMILMHLAKREKFPSQKQLAEHLNITPAAVTGALKKLESDGYVEVTLGQDNRYNELRITEKGRELVEHTKRIFFEIDTDVFDGFTEEELDSYISCLEKLQANMKKQCERKEP